jgi:hypothetical protein
VITAVGDFALIDRVGELVLAGPRGIVASLETERWAYGHEVAYGDVVAHASLADPPRFAVIKRALDVRNGGIIDARNLELLDPTTGETQGLVDGVYCRDLLGFDPTGARLLVSTRSSLAVVDGDGLAREIPDRGVFDGPFAGVVFSRDGKRALLRESTASFGARMVLLDLDAAIVKWDVDVDARGFVVDSDFTRALVLEADEADGNRITLVSLWDLAEGRRIANAYEHLDEGTQLRNLWSNRDLTKLAVMDWNGRTRTLTATKRDSHWLLEHEHRLPLETLLDMDRVFAFYAGDNGAIVSHLVDGTVAIAPKATRLCFAGTGAPVVLVGGAAHVLSWRSARDDGGTAPQKSASFDLVEGPTKLVDIAPHPRGVIVVDRDDCAHMIELPR